MVNETNGNSSDSKNGFTRKEFLKSAAAAGLIATPLAGCTGNSEEESNDPNTDDGNGGNGGDGTSAESMVVVSGPSDSAGHAMMQGAAAEINQDSEMIRVDARPGGSRVNINRLSNDEADMGYTQTYTAGLINEQKEPFTDLSFTPNQIFHMYDVNWFFITNNPDIQAITDIQSDHAVSPGPQGSGSGEALTHLLNILDIDFQRRSIEFTQQASAMKSGRLDVGIGATVNGSIETGWLQQNKSTANLRTVNIPDSAIETLEEDAYTLPQNFDTGGRENWSHIHNPLTGITHAYCFLVRNEYSYDAVYEYMTQLNENIEAVQESHALWSPVSEVEWWVESTFDMPFHPAAADFYQEQGVWRDEFTRGEE